MVLQKNLLIGLILALGFQGNAMASTGDGVNFGIHHLYESTRAAGMGDAFVAVANDYSAIFYNPAGLARREDGELNLSLDIGITQNGAEFQSQSAAASAVQGTDAQKQQAMMDLIAKQYGKTLGVRSSLFNGILVEPHWGVAVIPADVSLQGTFHQGVGPTINTTLYVDTTVALGYGDDIQGFLPGRFSWGFTGKFVNRGYFSKAINAVELAADSNLIQTEDLHEGYGVDGDLGFLWTPALARDGLFSLLRYTRPTFGLVVRNVAETKFTSSAHLFSKDDSTLPEPLYRVVDIGSRWEYPSLWLFGGRGTLDIRDIGHPDFSVRKGLHAGLEFDWTVANWWKGNYRVGVSEGFYTAGISALFAVFNLDLVTYAEDIGTYDTPVENRIYALRMNINW